MLNQVNPAFVTLFSGKWSVQEGFYDFDCKARGRAALVRGGTQFHARDTRTAGSLARLDAVGAKFGRHTAKIKNPYRKNKPAKKPAAAAEKGTGNPDRHMAYSPLPGQTVSAARR